ncbi:MAG: copper-binding protein [Nitrosomonadales bacterium]|nr:copper-binding protein [Nitrosomonadales bacterium]
MSKLTIAILSALLAHSGTAVAASHEHHDMSSHQTRLSAATYSSVGVVKAINTQDAKVQVAHEPIAELGWPAMNMWFALKTPLPRDIKVGDHVRFEMMQESNKQWVIVKIGRK